MRHVSKPIATGICIIRHGETDWNAERRIKGHTDIPLTEVGLTEAAAAGRRLAQAGLAFDEVHGSALQRSRQMAEALLAAMGTPAVPFLPAGGCARGVA